MQKQNLGLDEKNGRLVGQYSLGMCVGRSLLLILGHVFLLLMV